MPSVDELRLKQKEIEDQIKDQLKEEKKSALSNIRSFDHSSIKRRSFRCNIQSWFTVGFNNRRGDRRMFETITYGKDELKKHIGDYLNPKVLDEYIKTLPKKPKQKTEEPEDPKIGLEKFFSESKGE